MNRQNGFGVIAAIVILVIMALLASAIVSLSSTQQITSAQDVMSAKAWQAARAGNEWGLYKALNSSTPLDAWKTCPNGAGKLSQTLDLTLDTGFQVTVTCESWPYKEGESGSPLVARDVRVFQIKAIACPATTPVSTCPAANASVSGVAYIERTRVVLATN